MNLWYTCYCLLPILGPKGIPLGSRFDQSRLRRARFVTVRQESYVQKG